ncbi:MAG: hypothetical protein Tsb0020_52660 [Haliangiales bacterium]
MSAPDTMEFGCICGTLRGHARAVSPRTGTHVVCMCDDCQAFALYLNRDELLDAAGGTEIFQLTPSQLSITQGGEHLRCMRLSPKGTLRWYANCCKTPLANTMPSARVAFVGIPVVALHPADRHAQTLGPIRARIHARFARPNSGLGGHPRAPLGLILRAIRLIGVATLLRKHTPSPFFDERGAPTCEPMVISLEQRKVLYPGRAST